MIRKYFISLLLSLVTLIASAQISVGQWKIHPYFVGDIITNCVDTKDKVYYLSGGSLFCYDKTADTNTALNAMGEINDIGVNQIYYSIEKDQLYVVYKDCNLDIIKSNGAVYNISAIKDVVLNMSQAKAVNDITFSDGKAYVATSFGFIVIDEESLTVTEVRNFGINVTSVAIVGNHRILSSSNKFYYCNTNEQVEALWRYKNVSNSKGDGTMIPINDNKFFLFNSLKLYQVTINESSDGTLQFSHVSTEGEIPSMVQRCATGFVASHYYYTTNDSYGNKIKHYRDYYYTFDENGNNPTLHNGEGIYSSQLAGNWWTMSQNGLTNFINENIGKTVMVPNGISIKDRAYWSTYDSSLQRVLLCRTAENRVLENWESTTNTEINSWDGAQWHNITPPNIGDFGGNYWIVVSPNEPNTYFYCSRKNGGIAKVQNDSIVARYNPSNSNSLVSVRATSLAFDSKGNLWAAQPYAGFKASTPDPSPDAVVITAEKQALNEVTPNSFIVNDMGKLLKDPEDGYKRMAFGIGAGDTKVYSTGSYNAPLIIWNNNEDLSLNQYRTFESFLDHDNKYYSTYGWVYIKADNNGIIWIGTVSGVISFDPREAFNSDFRINRNKVTIDEGAPVSEILLEGTQVNCIDCDAQNRKWIATNTAGLYLVSADGSEIIKHFNKSNSVLPTDQIYSVCCNRATNSVLVVTPGGVLEYFYDATTSASDYSNVYAYPNPVQSNFTGYVTINGLMDNSNVVITDAAGAVVASTTSTGGTALWDACDSNKVPVKTGMYKVYAAQGTTPSTSGKPVTKIAVIK